MCNSLAKTPHSDEASEHLRQIGTLLMLLLMQLLLVLSLQLMLPRTSKE